MIKRVALFLMLAAPATAESVVATRVVRAQTLLTADDITVVAANVPGALVVPSDAIGLEARVTLYPGRAVRLADLGPPALVERNQIVTLIYNVGGLGISTEGRALARGGAGEVIKAMNLSSRVILSASVAPDGTLHVGAYP